MDLITGATGFIGSHVLYRLLKSGRHVKALYRDETAKNVTREIFSYYESDPDDILSQVVWVKGDLTDMLSLSENIGGVNNVFHTAGLVSYLPRHRKLLKTVNVRGTANLVNACLEKKVRKLIHLSSVATLGISPGIKSDENSMWKHGSFKSDYSVSKYQGELEVWRGINEGLDAVIVNPSVVIGPGMWLGPAEGLINAVKRGLKFYPGGGAGYVDVRDVATIMVQLAETGITGERFILNAENIAHRDVINLIADAIGSPRPQYPMSPFIANVACILEYVISKVSGTQPRLTKSTVRTANDTTTYNNSRITERLNIKFITVKESIDFSIEIYKSIEMDRNG